jgi:hypothetical protein
MRFGLRRRHGRTVVVGGCPALSNQHADYAKGWPFSSRREATFSIKPLTTAKT